MTECEVCGMKWTAKNSYEYCPRCALEYVKQQLEEARQKLYKISEIVKRG